MRYALIVAYCGTNYCGWQVQPNGVSVQGKLEEAATAAFGQRISVVASGRTDSGVHAAGQVCHMDAELNIDPKKLAAALNYRLPEDISVLASAAAPAGFDANRSAKKKTYCYRTYVSRREHPLKAGQAVAIYPAPDIALMRQGAQLFCGEHDFAAYCAAGSSAKTTVRTVCSVEVEEAFSRGCRDINIWVCGGGFLYNMVRTMAGTLLALGCGRLSPEDIAASLKNADRSLVGKTMPAKGLTLESVDYGADIFAK